MKIVYYCAATLDGYIAESDDSIGWLTGYEGSFEGAAGLDPGPLSPGGSYERFYAGVGAMVSGSVTYEFILGHLAEGGSWPYADKPYWVLSSRELPLPPGETGVRITDATVDEIIEPMREAAAGGQIWVIGGGNVASQFVARGLLDELDLTVVPVVLGAGKPLFEHRLPQPLQLKATNPYANGMVGLRYAVGAGA